MTHDTRARAAERVSEPTPPEIVIRTIKYAAQELARYCEKGSTIDFDNDSDKRHGDEIRAALKEFDAALLAAHRAPDGELAKALQAFMEPMRHYEQYRVLSNSDELELRRAYQQAIAVLEHYKA